MRFNKYIYLIPVLLIIAAGVTLASCRPATVIPSDVTCPTPIIGESDNMTTEGTISTAIPPIDAAVPAATRTATFALG
ncbi:hypothetical protein ACFLV2_02305 [Chloroflexota bacterium]